MWRGGTLSHVVQGSTVLKLSKLCEVFQIVTVFTLQSSNDLVTYFALQSSNDLEWHETTGNIELYLITS